MSTRLSADELAKRAQLRAEQRNAPSVNPSAPGVSVPPPAVPYSSAMPTPPAAPRVTEGAGIYDRYRTMDKLAGGQGSVYGKPITPGVQQPPPGPYFGIGGPVTQAPAGPTPPATAEEAQRRLLARMQGLGAQYGVQPIYGNAPNAPKPPAGPPAPGGGAPGAPGPQWGTPPFGGMSPYNPTGGMPPMGGPRPGMEPPMFGGGALPRSPMSPFPRPPQLQQPTMGGGGPRIDTAGILRRMMGALNPRAIANMNPTARSMTDSVVSGLGGVPEDFWWTLQQNAPRGPNSAASFGGNF